ncbi:MULTISPECIES: MFS transporter [unclassified Lactobacillus]|uniref:MFS transporter n=1 Tax=unclassified Lactobacillus TaxID=2620435 RepID=UPI0023F7C336|nr:MULTISPECIES: MFS transporter [unclassified Lactobacillus]WEV36819.1 MFS transporter [Lactobacillus sp. ESL0677]WEV50945.1 MFS transporter [Lactobacillus sp. ESL0700]WEV62076.1 MFS transporter [Lactobacillus sp. ESL0731]
MEVKQMPKLSNYRWVILALAASMDIISNYIQFQVSALATKIMPALHLTQPQFSSLLMAPMLVAVVMSIPAGSLADKFGAKKVVMVGCIVSVLGAYGRIIANNFVTMMLMLLMFGVYMSILSTNTIKIFGIWFKQDTNVAMGVFFASASIGIMLSQITNPLFPDVKTAYMFSSTVLLILSICWALFAKDAPKGEVVPPSEPAMKYVKVAIKSKNTWLVALCGGCGMAASMAYSGILPQAFTLGRGMSSASAGVMAAVATVGSFFGSMVGPTIINKLKHAKIFMCSVTAIAACSMFITWYVPMGTPLIINLIIGGLLGAMTGPIVQSMPISFPEIGPKYAGSAGGIVGMASTLLSYFVPVFISAIAGRSFAANFMIEAIVTAMTIIIMLILPDANKGKR